MLDALDRLDEPLEDLRGAARRVGHRLIWRGQQLESKAVVVQDGRTEGQSFETGSGQSVQLIGADGATAFGWRDQLDPREGRSLVDRLSRVLSAGERLRLSRATWPELAPERDRVVPDAAGYLPRVDLDAIARQLKDWEAQLKARHPGISWRLSARFEVDAWRVVRDDGTDVTFAIPRGLLAGRATTTSGERHANLATLFVNDVRALDDDTIVRRFLKRVDAAARRSLQLDNAPVYPAGSPALLIDYALAKGLAHEAFGHAAEADGFRSSILATDGRYRAGHLVGPETVSIVDEPVESDHAWQPFSANGVRRQPATLVDRGRLRDGLSDPWSAEPGGVPLTGAARAESFRHAPQPRMTNIRIEVEGAQPLDVEFEDLEPEDVRDLLLESDVLRRHESIAYLSGYSGGQVNTTTGDFVFNCKAIYELSRDGVTAYRPAIFSGSMFGALGSIREAFGPLLLDAIGYCGKWGQSVPSSGGSHYLLALDPDPSVRLGGRSA